MCEHGEGVHVRVSGEGCICEWRGGACVRVEGEGVHV